MLVPELPGWMAILKPDSLLNSRDVAQIFGYKSAVVLVNSANKGAFPKADHTFKSHAGNRSLQWKKATIINEIERRKAIKDKHESIYSNSHD